MISFQVHPWEDAAKITPTSDSEEMVVPSRDSLQQPIIIGWSNDHFNNLHFNMSHETTRTLHVSNTQQLVVFSFSFLKCRLLKLW